jgi:hypothetical protein
MPDSTTAITNNARSERHQHVRSKSSWFVAVLALNADDGAENYGEQQANCETDELFRFGYSGS